MTCKYGIIDSDGFLAVECIDRDIAQYCLYSEHGFAAKSYCYKPSRGDKIKKLTAAQIKVLQKKNPFKELKMVARQGEDLSSHDYYNYDSKKLIKVLNKLCPKMRETADAILRQIRNREDLIFKIIENTSNTLFIDVKNKLLKKSGSLYLSFFPLGLSLKVYLYCELRHGIRLETKSSSDYITKHTDISSDVLDWLIKKE